MLCANKLTIEFYSLTYRDSDHTYIVINKDGYRQEFPLSMYDVEIYSNSNTIEVCPHAI